MPIPIVTHPTTGITWQPSKRQVIAAAMAVARVDVDGWNRLQQSARDDLMIDGHAAIIAAYRQSPQDAFADHSGKGDAGDMVCMTREHADLYSELFAVSESHEEFITKRQGMTFEDVQRIIVKRTDILARLRALASPERTTP